MDDSFPPVNGQCHVCPEKMKSLVSALKITAEYERAALGHGADYQMSFLVCFFKKTDGQRSSFSHSFQICAKIQYWPIRFSVIDWYCPGLRCIYIAWPQ